MSVRYTYEYQAVKRIIDDIIRYGSNSDSKGCKNN